MKNHDVSEDDFSKIAAECKRIVDLYPVAMAAWKAEMNTDEDPYVHAMHLLMQEYNIPFDHIWNNWTLSQVILFTRKIMKERGFTPGAGLKDSERLVLRVMLRLGAVDEPSRVKQGDIRNTTDYGESTIKNALRELSETGLVAATGNRAGTRYHLTPRGVIIAQFQTDNS